MSYLMDEFEFKPLTEGLGFEKSSLRGYLKDTKIATKSVAVDLTLPLPREKKIGSIS